MKIAKTLAFSDRQMELLRHATSDSTACFAGGAVRSGKTYANCAKVDWRQKSMKLY